MRNYRLTQLKMELLAVEMYGDHLRLERYRVRGAAKRRMLISQTGRRLRASKTIRCSVFASATIWFEIAEVKSKFKEIPVKIVVIGGSGLIGSRLVNKLREDGHEVVAASPSSGVNTLTGEGLAEALKGASVVVDVSNAPSWEDAAVMNFFETSTRNLLTHEATAGVRHHVVLSVVGSERMLDSGYFRAKIAQENLIKASSIPNSIVRATQFYEFVKGIADFSTDRNTVRLPPVLIQPMAADDVSAAVGLVALGAPVNGTVEVGGPEKFRLDELIRQDLTALKDSREVVADPRAHYFGIEVKERALVPEDDAKLGKIRFDDWLRQSLQKDSRAA
jgi:uncharacterized protein YbjT (DUF2867 family)